MTRTLILAGLFLAAATPALPYGVPLCTSAEALMEAKENTGWGIQAFAVAEHGAIAYLSLGPNGQVEVFVTTPDGIACLIFGGGKVAEAEPPEEPTMELRPL